VSRGKGQRVGRGGKGGGSSREPCGCRWEAPPGLPRRVPSPRGSPGTSTLTPATLTSTLPLPALELPTPCLVAMLPASSGGVPTVRPWPPVWCIAAPTALPNPARAPTAQESSHTVTGVTVSMHLLNVPSGPVLPFLLLLESFALYPAPAPASAPVPLPGPASAPAPTTAPAPVPAGHSKLKHRAGTGLSVPSPPAAPSMLPETRPSRGPSLLPLPSGAPPGCTSRAGLTSRILVHEWYTALSCLTPLVHRRPTTRWIHLHALQAPESWEAAPGKGRRMNGRGPGREALGWCWCSCRCLCWCWCWCWGWG